MAAGSITLGVYTLDQIAAPKPGAGKGWAARLAAGPLVLADGARKVALRLVAEGDLLAEAVMAGPTRHEAGTPVTVERVAGVFLLRLDGRAFGVIPAGAGPAPPGALAAFGAGTLIDTPEGPRPAGALQPGDLVTTLANGSRPLAWIARRRIEVVEMLAVPDLRPVVFQAGAAGNTRDLVLSPAKRLLIDDWRAEVFFGEDRVLAAAEALVDDARVRVVLPSDGVDYVILLCDRHEVLVAEGALVESFHPGEAGLVALTPAERQSLADILPEAELVRRRAAFPIVRVAEARALRLPG